jgi:hypothetical protein
MHFLSSVEIATAFMLERNLLVRSLNNIHATQKDCSQSRNAGANRGENLNQAIEYILARALTSERAP